MRSKNIAYNPAFDHLRAFAAILIAYYHAHSFVLPALLHTDHYVAPVGVGPIYSFLVEGHTAVGLFMVLSGFIFTSSALGRRVLYPRFLFNRFLRIYPLMLAILVLAICLRPDAFRVEPFVRSVFIPLKVPLPLLFGETLTIEPWTAIFWTIAPEFQFYLIFPLLLVMMNRRGVMSIAVLLALSLGFRLFLSGEVNIAGLAYWTIIGRIDEFLIGMAAAALWRSGANTGRFLPLALVAVIVSLWVFNQLGGLHVEARWKALWPTIEGLVWAGFIIGYLDFAPRIPGRWSTLLVLVGECSYSMYLLHWPIESMLAKPAALAATQLTTLGFGPVTSVLLVATLFFLPAIVLVSLVTYRLIERPFLARRVAYLVPIRNRAELLPVEELAPMDTRSAA